MEQTHYYESHITIDPILDPDQLYLLNTLSNAAGFRVSDLYILKDDSKHTKDTFMTGRSKNYDTLYDVGTELCKTLKHHNFKIRRFKIEAVVYDERF